MKKFKARVLLATSLFVGAILAFLCIEHFRGEFALNSKLKQLVANGRKLDYKELLPPKPAPEQNAAFDLFALTNDLTPFFDLSKSAPSMKTFIAPGRAVASWRQNSWEVDKNLTNSWDKFGAEVEEAGSLLTRLENIWSKLQYDDGFDYANGFLDSTPRSLLIFAKRRNSLRTPVDQTEPNRHPPFMPHHLRVEYPGAIYHVEDSRQATHPPKGECAKTECNCALEWRLSERGIKKSSKIRNCS